ncbi:MAG: HlyD family efflux transporter periplasmic adaptor subunit [Cyclobacteriaceae bacterium]|nr:HlyD family efflux transporter periplasmic adaptor subunit [Cyclobacteriaceae bacterium]
MNRKLVLGIVFTVIIGGTVIFSNFLISQKELPPQRPKTEVKNYVKVVPVAYQPIPVSIEAFGRVGSSQQLNLVAEVGGKLLPGNISFKEGTNFRQGDILAKINNSEQLLNLQSRKSNFLNLVASVLPDLKIDFPDNYEQWDVYYNNIELNTTLPILPKNLTPKAKAFLASKNILSEYFTIKSLEENLSKYTLIAPYNGSIQSVSIEIGSVVNPGSVVASIIRTDRLELKVPIELKDIDNISIGTSVSIFQEGKENKSWTGKVVRMADFVDANTQSVSAYVSIDSPRGDVYDGMYLRAVIPGKVVKEGMRIQRSIVQNKSEVFVVEDSKLQSKQINIAQITQDEVVFNGLAPGSMLVVDAPSNASNNMVVEIIKD